MESREPWHCTMMYDEERQNEEYEAMWDEHVARTQYSLKTIDFIVGPQGAAAAVQLPKQLEQWYQIPDAVPHVSLLIGQGFDSKELGPMVKEASKVKHWTQNNLYVKLEKCKFHRHNMTFLGYVLSRMVVEMDQSKILPVTKWPVPATLKELQRFLGLANF
ncbi:hypothetical protein QTP70_013302 [Hemibagrus guttatus]|uniref:Uncharacterized protein n=1 Tax=Hemibagrus guttatus TaxID=175788 RepID=A0AAE0R1Z1_9TELE|nr:hypothetical protein QTP70_013302 [Hemibagrus guttatus]